MLDLPITDYRQSERMFVRGVGVRAIGSVSFVTYLVVLLRIWSTIWLLHIIIWNYLEYPSAVCVEGYLRGRHPLRVSCIWKMGTMKARYEVHRDL